MPSDPNVYQSTMAPLPQQAHPLPLPNPAEANNRLHAKNPADPTHCLAL